MKKIYFALGLLIAIGLFIIAVGVGGSMPVMASSLSIPDGYRLPFVGHKDISQGPYCPGTSHTTSEAYDFPMSVGTALYAPASGQIIYAAYDPSGFGYAMKIQHSNGSVSLLAHLKQFVETSGYVSAGELVAYSGNSGTSTGPHLHLEVKDYNGGYVNLRYLSGISWTSGDPNNPCAPPGTNDGAAFGASINNGVSLFSEYNYQGLSTTFNVPTYSPVEFPVIIARSMQIVPGWSAKLYPDVFVSGQCISQSYGNLDLIYTYSYLGVRAIEVFDNPTCSPPPPFDPIICLPSASSPTMRSDSSIEPLSAGGCIDPTPAPTPQPGVTPTPVPPPQTGIWSAKVFTSMNECNDSPDCNPTTTYYQTSVSGTNFNLNFPDGKAFGTEGAQWGMILRQTVSLSPGTYYIHADHDDGVKVWVNGSARMDVLGNSENNTTCPGIYLSGQTNLSILWKNTGGGAHLNFSIDQNGYSCQPQQKWSVKYYHDPNLCSFPNCNLSQIFCETDIYGTWFHINPYPNGTPCGDGDQTWGSVWKQTINFPEGDYVFWADHDDGVKIFLGDTNIMDLTVPENGNKACPARHLSGDVPVTVIHNNQGGGAYINVWWDTNTAVCDPPPPGNVWVWKDAGDVTHITVENGNINTANLYLGRSGQVMEITRSRWFAVSNGIEAIIPTDVDSFLVDQGNAPIIGSGNADEWYNGTDPHWVVKKKLFVWIDDLEQTRLTYLGEHSRPAIRYYTSGSSEQITTSLWYDLSDGSGIETIIPTTYEAMHVDKWIRPVVQQSASSWWVEDNYWLPKRLVIVNLDDLDKIRVNYYWGLPLPVNLGRYGQQIETRTDLWQAEVVSGHTNYYMILPDDVVAFEIQGGPVPRIDGWASWFMGNYASTHWVAEKTTWVYRGGGSNETLVFYSNPDVSPTDVPVIYYEFGDSVQHQTTSWWTKTADGLIMTLPRNVETFVLTRGPNPLLTDPVLSEWKSVSVDNKWISRKPIKVWIDWWGKTYVTYWHEQTLRPKIHYVLNNEEIVTTELWQNAGDGIQAMIPEGATHFLIEAWNQPYIEDSAAPVWKFSSLPDLWIELIKPELNNKIYMPLIIR